MFNCCVCMHLHLSYNVCKPFCMYSPSHLASFFFFLMVVCISVFLNGELSLFLISEVAWEWGQSEKHNDWVVLACFNVISLWLSYVTFYPAKHFPEWMKYVCVCVCWGGGGCTCVHMWHLQPYKNFIFFFFFKDAEYKLSMIRHY